MTPEPPDFDQIIHWQHTNPRAEHILCLALDQTLTSSDSTGRKSVIEAALQRLWGDQ